MRFLSNFGCKIIFMRSVNFWHQKNPTRCLLKEHRSRDLLVQVAYSLTVASPRVLQRILPLTNQGLSTVDFSFNLFSRLARYCAISSTIAILFPLRFRLFVRILIFDLLLTNFTITALGLRLPLNDSMFRWNFCFALSPLCVQFRFILLWYQLLTHPLLTW